MESECPPNPASVENDRLPFSCERIPEDRKGALQGLLIGASRMLDLAGIMTQYPTCESSQSECHLFRVEALRF